jgi:hypothetical protein
MLLQGKFWRGLCRTLWRDPKPRQVIAMRANSPFFPRLPVFLEFGRMQAITGLTFSPALTDVITHRSGSVYNGGNGPDSIVVSKAR